MHRSLRRPEPRQNALATHTIIFKLAVGYFNISRLATLHNHVLFLSLLYDLTQMQPGVKGGNREPIL